MPPLSLEALRGLTGRLVTLGLVHGVWIGLLAASATALALRVLPAHWRRPRHHLLLAALGLVAIGAPAAAMVQRALSRLSEPAPGMTSTIVVIPGRPLADSPEAPADVPRPVPARDPGWSPALLVASAVVALEALQPVVLAGWLLVAAPLALVLALGMLATAVRRREADAAPASIQGRSDRLARLLGLRRSPPVLVHPGLVEPCLCGLFRPAVLLPRRWLARAEQDPGRLDAILAHELAHARRLDLPVNLAQRLVEVAFFFHPAVHWLSRSLRRQRELCADALAVSLTGDPLALAEALESVARLRPSCRRATRLDASLGGDRLSLLPRVQELLGMTPTRPQPRLWPLAALPAAALVALLSASLGLAQDPPEPADLPQPTSHPLKSPVDPAGDRDPERRLPPELPTFDAFVDPAAHQDPNRQINYEIRFLDAGADLWRNRVKDRLRPAGDEGNNAWLLDEDEVTGLLTTIQGDVRASLIQAPKVTTFEGDRATISNTQKRNYVSSVEPIKTPESLAFRPTVEAINIGSTVDLSGSLLAGEIRLTTDIRDTSLVAMHTLKRHEEHAGMTIDAPYHVPTTKERRYQSTARIPDGSTLVVSLGLYEQADRLTGVARVASELLESLGGGRIEPRRDTRERLVLITPRRIILEEEEERLDIPAPEATPAAARGGGR